MGHIKGIFLDILLPKTKPIFEGIIYRPPNNINSLECFNKHLDDINLDNEIFLLGDFNINLLHNGKYILKENQAMQNRIPSTSLVSQYKSFCQRYSLGQIIKHVTRTICSSCTLTDHILTNFREKISQSGVIDISVSDHQLIYLTRNLRRMKSNAHKQIKIRSLKNYTIESLKQGLRLINFPDYEYFNDVDIAYSDFIQRITPVINKIAPFKEISTNNNCFKNFYANLALNLVNKLPHAPNKFNLDSVLA